MELVVLVLVLLLAVAVGGAIERWTPLGLPILLVAVGAAMSFLPGLDWVPIDPEVFLLLFIPPILFADAWNLPRRDFVRVLRPVLLLALGLVVLTVVGVGYLLHWLVPSMPLAVAFTIGAIVSPTDAIATVATTERLPLPSNVVNIVNAESLLNDASGLVAFKLAVAAAATGLFSSADVALDFVVLSGGGIAVGLAVVWAARQLLRRGLRLRAGNPAVITLLTVLVPYAGYMLSEALHVSGILAVVAAGLWTSGQEMPEMTAAVRRHLLEVWRMLGFALNGLVFVLLGLQLRTMFVGVIDIPPSRLALYAIALWVVLMLLRMAWVFASAHLRYRLRWGWAGSPEGPDWRRLFLVGWACVRGSITLATALSVPYFTSAGTPFPHRDLVVFLAASTIVLTLVLNGIPLPFLIQRLRIRPEDELAQEERHARAEIARAGTIVVEDALRTLVQPDDVAFAHQVLQEYAARGALASTKPERARAGALRLAVRRDLRLVTIRAERARLQELLEAGAINENVMRALEHELDERELIARQYLAQH